MENLTSYMEKQQRALAIGYIATLHALYFVVHCVIIDYTCLQVVLFEGKISYFKCFDTVASKMCHFDHECCCLGLCVNCFENVGFGLQSRKTVTSYHVVCPLG